MKTWIAVIALCFAVTVSSGPVRAQAGGLGASTCLAALDESVFGYSSFQLDVPSGGTNEGMRQGEEALRAGRLDDALTAFDSSLREAMSSGDVRGAALAYGGLGLTQLALGQRTAAQVSLTESITRAREIGDARIEARSLYNLALAQVGRGAMPARQAWFGAVRGEEARTFVSIDEPSTDTGSLVSLDAAAVQAMNAHDFALAARALSAAALTEPSENLRAAQARLVRAEAVVLEEQDPTERIGAALAVGDAAITRRIELEQAGSASEVESAIAVRTLRGALEQSVARHDERLEAYARGLLGRLYGVSGRLDEAIALTRQAAFLADRAGAAEVLFQWQGQLGALYEQRHDRENAIAAYEEAARTIQRVRPYLARATFGVSSPRQMVEPVLLAYADLLLQGGDPDSLRRALVAADQLKTIELERFFEDACVASAAGVAERNDAIGPGVAVVYPIIFEHRVDVIVLTQGGIWRESAPVERSEFERVVGAFRAQLETPGDREGLRQEGGTVYDWLLKNSARRLEQDAIDTIVFVPDGVLNGVPFSALYDRERREYVVQRYAIAVAVGTTVLSAGVGARRPVAVLAGVSQGANVGRSVFTPLPGVVAELEEVSAHIPGRPQPLLDDAFTLERLQMAARRPGASILHLATHARFGGTARETYLLAGGGALLTLDDLEQITSVSRIRGQAIDLLVLSACETASGNEYMTLGLAGVAYKAGARSVLGSLWRVNDAATARLTPRFYEALIDEGLPKAKALQRAQLALLNNNETSHPFYWAPFVLVGNWE